MRIETLLVNFDYQTIVNNAHLTADEKKQFIELFEKIIKKGHLGASGSSRLDYLLKKIENTNLVLVPKGVPHVFVLKTQGTSEIFKHEETTPVNERVGPHFKTKLQLAINNFKNNSPEEKKLSLKTIRELLEDPCIDINLTDKEGWTAAYQVTQILDREVLELILSFPGIRLNSKNIDGSTPLIRAADRNNITAVKLLLQKGVKVNACNDVGTALSYASRKGHKEVVELLIQAGAKVNQVSDPLGKTPFKLAKEGGHKEVAELLEQAGGNETTAPSFLQTIVREGGKRLIETIKETAHITDELGRTVLHYWAYEPKAEVIQLLQEMKINIEAEDKFKRTPLHYAAMQGNSHAVALLTEQGAFIDHQDKHGYMPLFWAAQYNKIDIVNFLIGKGANLTQTDKFGWTALDKAAESNSSDVCEILCQKIDVNRKAPDGRTALHKAVINGSYECIALLLKHGANPNIADNNGKLPIDYAQNDLKCRGLLKEA